MKNLAVSSLPGAAKKPTSVVIVEDDPASADVLQRRLQANGMKVAVGKDGGEGLALVREIVPDLVLLDVMLPDTDGYDVCLRIKSDGAISHIPVIFLSARGEVVDKVRGLSCGAADYVTKPWNAAELLARIDAVLLQSRNARPPRLEPQVLRPQRARPVATVALKDQARRATAEKLLAAKFDIANGGSEAVDLVLVDEGVTPDDGLADAGTAILVIARGSETPATEFARLDGDLSRHAELLVREMRLVRDMGAAADALITLATVARGARPADDGSRRARRSARRPGRRGARPGSGRDRHDPPRGAAARRRQRQAAAADRAQGGRALAARARGDRAASAARRRAPRST